MLQIIHITKRYHYQKVLDDVSLDLPKTGMIAIVGPSGCGKSTLLHIIGGIDQDFQGDIKWQGRSVKKRLSHYSQKHVGFIFQQFHLIMWLSVHQNITMSQFFRNGGGEKNLDIDDFQNLKMSSLSLGQRQRIAYLRAYYQQNDILLCDEPTGSLDPGHADEVMNLLREESKQRLVIIVSHDLKLVERYCDEMYTMYDGKIERHQCFHASQLTQSKTISHHRKIFPLLQLSWMSLKSHKGRSLQLIFGLTISFLCIVMTLTMSRGLETQIQNYIYSLIPSSCISFQAHNHQSLTLDFVKELQSQPSITRTQLYLQEYEFLGIGFVGERYQDSQVLFIGDDASPYQDIQLDMGQYPQEDHEIIVSLSTAQHLCKDENLSTLLNKKVYAWYQYRNEVKSIAYQVVGITNQTTALDTLYQRENAYIYLLKDVYQFDEKNVKSDLGMIYIHKDYQRSEIIKELKKQYPEYKFLEVGATTTQNISQSMQQVRVVLMIFSGLAILSSLFLIGEVMFLNVVQKKKDFAILICFGARRWHLLKIVLFESLEIVLSAQIICAGVYYQLLSLVNAMSQEVLLNNHLTLSFDYELLLLVYGVSFILVFISQLPPLLYVFRLNTIAALKD